MSHSSIFTQLSSEILIKKNESVFLAVNSLQDCRIIVEEGAKLMLVMIANTPWDGHAKVIFECKGRNSEVLFLSFVIGTKTNAFRFETISQQLAPHTKAYYHVRAVMRDDSSIEYKGDLMIDQKGQGADAYLSHRTLLLSENARAHTTPALEILADDVKAGHSAAVGKIDSEALFYTLSRGIDEETAKKLFIIGFFEQQVLMISDPNFQEKIRNEIMKHFV